MIPRRLSGGDTIGIVSPSYPVTVEFKDRFISGIKVLERFGLKVKLGKHVYTDTLGFSATPSEKAADINGMFTDRSVDAIICSQGGDSANSCLPYIDWETIRINPKIFIGISDITVLLNAISFKTGLVTFHGNDIIWGFGRKPTGYDITEFKARLFDGKTGAITPAAERVAVRSGKAEGRLLGGNVRCLLKLSGTPYFPDLDDSILFLEALSISPERCFASFHQLRQMGVFDRIKGVLIGYIDGLQTKTKGMSMESILLEVTSDMTFPILKTNDYGHNCPNTVLPVGGRISFDSHTRLIEIIEPCVL
jgi:muramoyltetrapeptide carboxypeptidase